MSVKMFMLCDERGLPEAFAEALPAMPRGSRLSEAPGWIVLRWRGADESAPAGAAWVLQPPDAVRRARDAGPARRMLAAHGLLPGGAAEAAYGHVFRVPVFHMRALAVRRELVGGGARSGTPAAGAASGPETRLPGPRGIAQDIPLAPGNGRVRKLCREAVRAVYALGLDYGVVRLAIRGDGRIAVLGVDAEPIPDASDIGAMAEAVRAFAAEWRPWEPREADIRLGADPEFVLRRADGKVVPASRYFAKTGAVGCDSAFTAEHRIVHPLAELRPLPQSDPEKLVAALRRGLRQAAERIGAEEMVWQAGGMPAAGLPLGGHIHFSGVPLSSGLIRTLDNYLTLSLLMVEDASTGRRRPRFGWLGDAERKEHGGFEYRTPPSWLLSPRLAAGVLALAKLIAGNWPALKARPFDSPDQVEAYMHGKKAALRPHLDALWADLRSLPAYASHAFCLEPFAETVFSGKIWNEQRDIRKSWRIPPYG